MTENKSAYFDQKLTDPAVRHISAPFADILRSPPTRLSQTSRDEPAAGSRLPLELTSSLSSYIYTQDRVQAQQLLCLQRRILSPDVGRRFSLTTLWSPYLIFLRFHTSLKSVLQHSRAVIWSCVCIAANETARCYQVALKEQSKYNNSITLWNNLK